MRNIRCTTDQWTRAVVRRGGWPVMAKYGLRHTSAQPTEAVNPSFKRPGPSADPPHVPVASTLPQPPSSFIRSHSHSSVAVTSQPTTAHRLLLASAASRRSKLPLFPGSHLVPLFPGFLASTVPSLSRARPWRCIAADLRSLFVPCQSPPQRLPVCPLPVCW
jgi:hypothetical protein